MSQDQQGVNLKPSREESLLKLGCDRGDTNACFRVGRTWLKRVSDDVTVHDAAARSQAAHALFARACEAGEVSACLELGLSATTGRAHYPKDLTAGVRWLNEACAGDVAVACYEVAQLQAGPGTALSDPVRARRNMDKACRLGAGAACASLGKANEQGLGMPKNIAKARQLHEKACELKQPESCLALGELTLDTDAGKALRLFGEACAARVSKACLLEGILLEGRTPGAQVNPEAALQRYATACADNMSEACAYAGLLKLETAGDEIRLGRDERATVAGWIEKGCKLGGVDEACLVYGDWMAQGRAGLKQSGAGAALLLGPLCARASTEPDFAPACQRLGRLSEAGAGVTRNVLGAAAFYNKGCAAGHEPSCLSHAMLLWKGSGGYKRNPEEAVSVFKRQCAQGKPMACLSLGYAQQMGIGAARNLSDAKKHFEQACSTGIQAGCAYLGQYYLTVNRSEEDRETGQKLLRSACDSANGEGCLFLAELDTAPPTQKQELLRRACVLDVTEACLALEAGP